MCVYICAIYTIQIKYLLHFKMYTEHGVLVVAAAVMPLRWHLSSKYRATVIAPLHLLLYWYTNDPS